MYCLDTNIVVEIMRGNEDVIREVEKIWDEKIFVTTITLCELYKGAYGHVKSSEKVRVVDNFLKNVEIVSADIESSKIFGEFWQKLKKRGKQVNNFDSMIASIAKANGLIVVTMDKHFKDIGCQVVMV